MNEQLLVHQHLEGFVCPPEFWRALGYTGEARYVACYWEQCGDEAAWADGRESLVGAFWPAYKALFDHNWSPGHPYHWLMGASDMPALFWLLIDRETADGWIVPAGGEADEILASQWPPVEAEAEDVAADGLGVVRLADELSWPAPVAFSVEAVRRAIQQEEQDYQALLTALAARPARWQKEGRAAVQG